MPNQVTTHTFNKGMITDTNINNKSKEAYDYAENLRHTSDEYDVLGALTNLKGHEAFDTIDSTLTIVTHKVIRDNVYLLCTTKPSAGGSDSIYRISIDTVNKDLGTPVLLYGGGNLGLDNSKNTDVVGVYESSDVIKLYWTTEEEYVKVANVATYLTTDGLVYNGVTNDWVDADRFNMVTSQTVQSLDYVGLVSGSLTTGRVQYYYSLYKKYLQETATIGPTSYINLYQDKENIPSINIKGDYTTTDTNKGVNLSLTLGTDDLAYFDYIRVYRVHYTNYNDVPTITILNDTPIVDTTSYNIIDTGSVGQGTLTVEEFSIITNLYSAKTITTKDQRAILGNTTEELFDVDFDARAYRFNPDQDARVYDAYGSYTTPEYTITSSNWSTIDDDANLICPTNDIDNDIPTTGTDDTSSAAAFLTDTTQTWTTNQWVGYTLYNTTTSNSAVVTANTATTITASGSGPWNSGDGYLLIQEYIYQEDGSTMGGEGPHVTYTFATSAFQLNNTPTYSNAQTFTSDTGDYSQTEEVFTHTGYQRGEIYRIGIIFYNALGQKSKVKWVGDVRFPYGNTDTPNFERVGYSVGSTIYAYAMGIRIEIDALPSEATVWEVVRAKREKQDRSIISTGTLSFTMDTTGTALGDITTKFPYPLYDTTNVVPSATQTINYDVVNFISAEEVFQGSTDILTGDYIDILGDITNEVTYSSSGSFPQYNANNNIKYRDLTYYNNYTYLNRYEVSTVKFTRQPSTDVVVGAATAPIYQITNAAGGNYVIHSLDVVSLTHSGSNFSEGGYHSSCSIIEVDSTISSSDFDATHSDYELPYAVVKRNTTNRYGGESYVARENTEYISCGKITDTEASGESFYGGDTYINLFDYKSLITGELVDNTSFPSIGVIFPTESPINLSLRSDDHPAKVYANSNSYLIREYAGAHTDGNGSNTYTQETDLYLYNSIYSQEQNIKSNYALNNETFNVDYDSRLVYSDKKINNEPIDSWLKYPVNNFLDVDSSLGQIEVLHNFNNDVYFWQENAFGIVPINERSLISDNNPGALALGVGSVMSRYAYITKDYGTTNLLSVVDVGSNLYWIDSSKKTILNFSNNGLQDLSKSSGVKKIVKELIDENSSTDAFTFIGVQNIDYGEVLFKLNDDHSLLYNETLGICSSIITSDITYLFNAHNIVTTFNGQTLYGHDKTYNYNEFLSGTVLTHQDSILRITNSELLPYTKVYDKVSFFTYAKNSDGEIINDDYFDTITFWNDYQYTTTGTLVLDTNLERIERGYALFIPRNIVDGNGTTNIDIFDAANHDSSRLFKERFRDKYLTTEFTYSNSDYLFVIPEIQFTYRYSKPNI